MVPARRRARRPRSDVRTRDVRLADAPARPIAKEAANLLAGAAKLGHVAASYDLGLLYMAGQLFPQDFARAAELFRTAAQAGSPEAHYALARSTRKAAALPRTSTRQRAGSAAARRPITPTHRSNMPIALFNRHRRRQGRAAPRLPDAGRPQRARSRRTARPDPRLRRGVPADPVEAIKWHLVSKANGATDLRLDDFHEQAEAAISAAAAEKAAQSWVEAVKASRLDAASAAGRPILRPVTVTLSAERTALEGRRPGPCILRAALRAFT